ncbi:MAG: hypothetical protein V3V96_14605 [Acidiferrobacterales bacterium]
MGPQGAVAALTVDASGREVLIDARFPAEVIEQLQALRHTLKLVDEDPGMTGNSEVPQPSPLTTTVACYVQASTSSDRRWRQGIIG